MSTTTVDLTSPGESRANGVPAGAPPSPMRADAIANAGPLGLFAFALTTFLLSMVNANSSAS